MVRVVAREGSRDNISVHHHRMNVVLIQTQFVEYLLASTEHKRRAKSDNWPKSGGLDSLPTLEHQMD